MGYVPPGHEWFFNAVCDRSQDVYLLHRRLLPVTFHNPAAMVVPETVRPPVLTADFEDLSWAGAAVSAPFTLNGIHAQRGAPSGATRLKTLRDKQALYVMIRCEDPAGVDRTVARDHVVLRGKGQDYLRYVSDCVSILFDVDHEHDRFIELVVTPSGAKMCRQGGRGGALHPVNPIGTVFHSEIVPLDQWPKWDVTTRMDPDRKGWTAAYRVPFALLRAVAANASIPTTIGFNAARLKHSTPAEQSVWSPVEWFGENVQFPLRFGDLYLTPVPVTVGPLWLGEWFLGHNRIVAEARNHTGHRLSMVWRVAYVTPAGDDGRKRKPFVTRTRTVLRPGVNIVRIPYVFPDDAWGPALRLRAYVPGCLRPAYEARYQAMSLLRSGGKPKSEPAHKARNYNQLKMEALASRMPRLIRVTTADGAPSDFCLRSPDRRITIDLMRGDAMRRIARLIEQRFRTDDDRLAAASLLARQPDVMVYERVDRFGDLANTPLSVMRFGSGICGAFATVIKGLVEALHPVRGGRFTAYRCGIWDSSIKRGRLIVTKGHCMVAVLGPDGRRAILNNGSLYYATGDRRLLTFDDTRDLRKFIPWAVPPNRWVLVDSGSQIWPAGAEPDAV